jgi:hypothetical protein
MSHVELQVADTGVGISPSIIDPILQGVEKQDISTKLYMQ